MSYHEAEAFAPGKTYRVRPWRVEQVKIAFPIAGAVEYRWRFSDGTTSNWLPSNDLLQAPPAAIGCEWRERIPVRTKVPRARKPNLAPLRRATPRLKAV